MAISKNVKKINKINAQNSSFKSALRTSIKKVDAAVSNKNKEEATSLLNLAVKKLDQSVTKGILHKNTVARTKSRLTKAVNAI